MIAKIIIIILISNIAFAEMCTECEGDLNKCMELVKECEETTQFTPELWQNPWVIGGLVLSAFGVGIIIGDSVD